MSKIKTQKFFQFIKENNIVECNSNYAISSIKGSIPALDIAKETSLDNEYVDKCLKTFNSLTDPLSFIMETVAEDEGVEEFYQAYIDPECCNDTMICFIFIDMENNVLQNIEIGIDDLDIMINS